MPEKNQTLDSQLKQSLENIATTIRGLSMDAVQKADSGHPGMPMGFAEIGAYLWGQLMNFNPKNPHWINRDRLILSAGHGSMWLYSGLFLSGYNLTLEDLKNFRQLHSCTPGHPESFETEGVETTSGPLGQGFGNAVGQALGFKLLAAKFNTDKHPIFDNKIYCVASDGDLMEGISAEASSFAGHLQLDNLIVIYDSNNICLDGPLDESFSDDTRKRYEAYHWEVLEMNGNDIEDVARTLEKARHHQTKPLLVIAHTVIGKGSPNKAGSSKAHGSPLGPDEIIASKKELGIPLDPPFYVPQAVTDFFQKKNQDDQKKEREWQSKFENWAKENPALFHEYEIMLHQKLPQDLEEKIKKVEIKAPVAGRKASQDVIAVLADLLPQLMGGSADLSGSDLTMMKKYGVVAPKNFKGRNIKFGVREFSMATMATGLSQTGFILPFVGTFLTFSDYMRNAIRLASMMKQHVIYQFTHDSIFLGEDGPTHQPVEHYAALRAIPHLHVIRPGDANEVKMAWVAALNYQGPTAILLSRQNLPNLTETDVSYSDGVGRGAYVIKKEKSKPDYTLVATGSELHLALDVAKELEKMGKDVRVISMPCWEIFEEQDAEYKEEIFGGELGQRVSIEAGVDQGWYKYIGRCGIAICMERFGASAPAAALAKEFGFTVEAILERIL